MKRDLTFPGLLIATVLLFTAAYAGFTHHTLLGTILSATATVIVIVVLYVLKPKPKR